MTKLLTDTRKKRCSACTEWKPIEQFYGRKYKQPRCIPCYNAAYGAYYRRSLKESKMNKEVM